MNIISRTLTGVITIILGVYITYESFLDLSSKDWLWGAGTGIFFIIIGIFIFFNKKEDEIEKIKNNKE
jgi:uncharacterized membrane protein YbhN (UPF0104 family)